MKLKINNIRKMEKSTNTLSNTPLKIIGSKKKSKGESKYLETNENESTQYRNLWDAARTVLRKKFTVINTYIKRKGRSQINNLMLHLKELEK